MKVGTFLAALTLLCSLGAGLAHATIVLGTLRTQPAVPRAGLPVTLLLELEDPTQIPTEDAYVLAEFRPEGQDAAEPISARFDETDTPGRYRAQVTLPEDGAWQLLLRDQTFRQEEATATLSLNVGTPTNPETLSFLFPPTATGPKSLGTWLLWLIGVPVLAGILVTVLVLRGGKEQARES